MFDHTRIDDKENLTRGLSHSIISHLNLPHSDPVRLPINRPIPEETFSQANVVLEPETKGKVNDSMPWKGTGYFIMGPRFLPLEKMNLNKAYIAVSGAWETILVNT